MTLARSRLCGSVGPIETTRFTLEPGFALAAAAGNSLMISPDGTVALD